MDAIYELRAFLEEGGQRKPFYLRISKPQASRGDDGFSCRIHAPELFNSDKEIFGADAQQASLLAWQFAKSLLEGKGLVDEAWRPIDLT